MTSMFSNIARFTNPTKAKPLYIDHYFGSQTYSYTCLPFSSRKKVGRMWTDLQSRLLALACCRPGAFLKVLLLVSPGRQHQHG
jgi:hypothetical protein